MLSYEKNWEWLFQCFEQLIAREIIEGEIRAVLTQRDTTWENYATYLYIPHWSGNSTAHPRDHLRYDSLILLRKTVALDQLQTLDDVSDALLHWPEVDFTPSQRFASSSIHTYFYGSSNEFAPMPIWSLELKPQPDVDHFNPPNGPFIDTLLPFYNNVAEAASEWLFDPWITRSSGRPSYPYRCFLNLSSAVFKDLSFDENGKLTIQIHTETELDDFWVKLVASTPGSPKTRQTKIAETKITFDLSPSTDELSVYLIDKHNQPHDLIVETRYDSTWHTPILHSPLLDGAGGGLLGKIQSGEGLRLEFKEWLPPDTSNSKYWELHKTVVAFANSFGGEMLIGIDDAGDIKGIENQLHKRYGKQVQGSLDKMLSQYQKDLRRNISNTVEPDVKVNFEVYSIGPQVVLSLSVEPGKERPYSIISSNDIYIRRGASDRKPNPAELRELMKM